MAAVTDAPSLSDESLVRAARAGDAGAFEQLVGRHFQLVYAVAYARLQNRETAEDLAQEVFLRAYLYLPRFKGDARFAHWLTRAARNLAIDWMRRKQCASNLLPHLPLGEVQVATVDDSVPNVREEMQKAEQHAVVTKTLAELPPDLREIILLHYMEDLSLTEIAERSGTHRSTVSRRLDQALSRLRGAMEPVIRESVAMLRPRTAATAKALAVAGAVGAMEAPARAAIADIAAKTGGGAATGTGAAKLCAKALAIVFAVAGVVGLLAIAAYHLPTQKTGETTGGSLVVSSGYSAANAYYLADELFGGRSDIAAMCARLDNITSCTHYAYPGGEKAAAKNPTAAGIDFLKCQVGVKVLRTLSVLCLLEGRREEALRILIGCERFGQLMAQGDMLLARMVGVALCSITNKGLELFVLDGCETVQELDHAWAEMEKVRAPTGTVSLDAAWKAMGYSRVYRKYIGIVHPGALANIEESVVRHKTALVQLDLVRMACAARRCLLVSGRFPAAAADFAPLQPAGPPVDLFAGTQPPPLKWHEDATSGELVCHSVGPDGKDDRGAVSYDPTNGTLSAGDIALRVPKQRKYPFPASGVTANSAAELQARFPDGLPPDTFAMPKGRGLGIADTLPVRVYSVGPDTNPAETDAAGTAYAPTVQYDPTNGVVSAGDIFIEVPARR